jgi:plasmid stability protein
MYNADMDDQGIPTATLTIRNVDAALKERLRVRAAQHGHSMEAELRDILQEILKEPEPPGEPHLYDRIRSRFAPLGGADDIELPPRELAGEPPHFD